MVSENIIGKKFLFMFDRYSIFFIFFYIFLGTCAKCKKRNENLMLYASPNHPKVTAANRTPDSLIRFRQRQADELMEKKKQQKANEQAKGTDFNMNINFKKNKL